MISWNELKELWDYSLRNTLMLILVFALVVVSFDEGRKDGYNKGYRTGSIDTVKADLKHLIDDSVLIIRRNNETATHAQMQVAGCPPYAERPLHATSLAEINASLIKMGFEFWYCTSTSCRYGLTNESAGIIRGFDDT